MNIVIYKYITWYKKGIINNSKTRTLAKIPFKSYGRKTERIHKMRECV